MPPRCGSYLLSKLERIPIAVRQLTPKKNCADESFDYSLPRVGERIKRLDRRVIRTRKSVSNWSDRLLLQLEVFAAALEATTTRTVCTAFLAGVDDFYLKSAILTSVGLPFLHIMTT